MEIVAKGSGGTVKYDGKTITIKRKGLKHKLQHGGDSTIVIALSSISAVKWKDPSWSSPGSIHFVTGMSARRGALEGGILSGSLISLAAPKSDENLVTFDKSQKQEFQKIRELVERAIARR